MSVQRNRWWIVAALLPLAIGCDVRPSPAASPAPTVTRDASRSPSATPAHGGMRDQSPTWSPDSTTIAFTTNPGSGGQIWSVNVDATEESRRLVPRIVTHPAWSPDGRRIAYAALRSGNWDIYIKDLPSDVETRLTTHAQPEWAPAWSPDGSRIAFFRSDAATAQGSIIVAKVDGSGERALTAEATDQVPQWSPDGSRITFQSHRDGNWEIYVMQADGTGQTRLTATPDRHDGEPAWSPDGRWIVFSGGTGSARDIYAIAPDGSGERRLTHLALELWAPRVSPDGTRIAFYEFPPGRIYLANFDGSAVRLLFGR